MPGNVPSTATNSFSPNTKARSADVNTNFSENVNWHSSFSYDAKHGTVFLQTSAKSADYTVLDTDGIHTILMTTGASNRTVTLPTAADNNGRILVVKKVDSGVGTCIIDGEGAETVDGSTTITLTDINEFATLQCNGTAWYVLDRSGATSADNRDNCTLTASVGSNALTIALKTKAGNDPSVADPVRLSFRNATAATGDYATIYATAATSIVVSSGSTLGHVSAEPMYFYVYALNNSGTIELAVSTKLFDDGSVQTTTAEGGAGAADSATTLYSTTARTSKAIRLLARLSSTQTTAGTWAAVPTEISLGRAFVTPATISVPNNAVDYAANTRMGLMAYSHGTTYSGGNAPTIAYSAGGGSLSSVALSRFIPYQMADASWRMKFNINAIFSSAARTSISITVAGVSFVTSVDQAIAGCPDGFVGGVSFALTAGTNTMTINHGSVTTDTYVFSGDVALQSKPTWAY